MDSDKTERISRRAYAQWETEGRPHGRHEEHWRAAEQEESDADAAWKATGTKPGATDPHPGMMGDGTEEQNLDQPGDPAARITAAEVEEAFAEKPGTAD